MDYWGAKGYVAPPLSNYWVGGLAPLTYAYEHYNSYYFKPQVSQSTFFEKFLAVIIDTCIS